LSIAFSLHAANWELWWILNLPTRSPILLRAGDVDADADVDVDENEEDEEDEVMAFDLMILVINLIQ
jgi:hypothetical protein